MGIDCSRQEHITCFFCSNKKKRKRMELNGSNICQKNLMLGLIIPRKLIIWAKAHKRVLMESKLFFGREKRRLQSYDESRSVQHIWHKNEQHQILTTYVYILTYLPLRASARSTPLHRIKVKIFAFYCQHKSRILLREVQLGYSIVRLTRR